MMALPPPPAWLWRIGGVAPADMATPEERAELWRQVCLQPPTAVSAGGFVLLLTLSILADVDHRLLAILLALLLFTCCLSFWRMGRVRSLLHSGPSLFVTAISFQTGIDIAWAVGLGWTLMWACGY